MARRISGAIGRVGRARAAPCAPRRACRPRATGWHAARRRAARRGSARTTSSTMRSASAAWSSFCARPPKASQACSLSGIALVIDAIAPAGVRPAPDRARRCRARPPPGASRCRSSAAAGRSAAARAWRSSPRRRASVASAAACASASGARLRHSARRFGGALVVLGQQGDAGGAFGQGRVVGGAGGLQVPASRPRRACRPAGRIRRPAIGLQRRTVSSAGGAASCGRRPAALQQRQQQPGPARHGRNAGDSAGRNCGQERNLWKQRPVEWRPSEPQLSASP